MRLWLIREWTLAHTLRQIEVHDTDYDKRYPLVFKAIQEALACGYEAGVRLDPTEPEWPVAYIELPHGQVSWHLPQHGRGWDGHDTTTKYDRCRDFYAEYGT